MIITINRECGSGGGEIARLLGKRLGFKVYGRAILDSIAEKNDMTIEQMDQVKAQNVSWWDDFCRFYNHFGVHSNTGKGSEITPMSLYYAEANLLRKLAEKESCIIIGRAGFHIFRDTPNAVHLLIMADRDSRINRIAQKQNLSQEGAAKIIDRIDKERDTFIKNVANVSRYDARHYKFTINVTGMEPEQAVESIIDLIKIRCPHS
jgi:cytidylate kinase